MTGLFQELGGAAPPTTELLTHSAVVAVFLLLLVGVWTLWLCGVEALQAIRAGILRRVRSAQPSLRMALVAQSQGEIERAYLILARLLKRNPDDHEASLVMWDVARDAGHPERAEQALLGVIRRELEREEHGAATRHWLELAASGCETPVEPELLVKLAPLLEASGELRAAAGALRRALASSVDGDCATLVGIARAAAALDRGTAEEAAWRAMASESLTAGERTGLTALLTRLYPADAQTAELELPAEAERATRARPRVRAARRSEPRHPQRVGQLVVALPLEFEGGDLRVEVAHLGKKRVRLRGVDGLAVAAIHGLGPRPVVVIDLLLNWSASAEQPLKIVRLRSDHFSPRRFVSRDSSPVEALRVFLNDLLARTGATPLPCRSAVQGDPFTVFRHLRAYHAQTLRVAEVTPR